MSANQSVPIACDLTAIDAEEREQHTLTAKEFIAEVVEVRELSDGYAFRLPVDKLMLRSAAEWMANERLCCPFLTFSLKVEAQNVAMWLVLTGAEDVKTFIRAEFGNVLSGEVAQAAGLG